ncbi:T9SS type A sorting domain-containing protein, partial [Carboxylicivirga sediminis]
NESSDEFTITPDAGYKLTSLQLGGEEVQWEDNAGVLTYTVTTVTTDVSLVAAFTQYFTVSATAGTGGAITPGSSEVLINEDSDEFTITPEAGYKLTSLLLDGVEVQWEDNAGVLTYTVSAVAADASLVAGFTQYFTVTVNANDGGTVENEGANEVYINELFDIVITPDQGYTITSVTINAGDNVVGELTEDNGVYFMQLTDIAENKNVEVTFELANSISKTSAAKHRVYPTVTNGLVNVEGDYERIEIVSLTGNVVKQLKNDTGGQLELYDLSPGTYIVVIHSKSGRTLSKIIKK